MTAAQERVIEELSSLYARHYAFAGTKDCSEKKWHREIGDAASQAISILKDAYEED